MEGEGMQEIDGREDSDFETACRFVIRLGTLAHGYGPQTRRIESYLSRVTTALGYSGIFSSTPTGISFAFRKKDQLWHNTHLVSLTGSGFNLAKLAMVGELVSALEAKKISVVDAIERLDEIDMTPPPYGRAVVALGYALCGAGFAGFLKGSWWDIILSVALSIVVYFIIAATEHSSQRVTLWVPFLCAFIAAVASALLHSLLPGIQVYLITLSAIIYLIPGFSVSMGIIELTMSHVISGMINLMNGLISLLMLFAGAWLGIGAVNAFLHMQRGQEASVDAALTWLFVMMLSAGLCLAFQTPPRDLFWALAGCAIAYGGILLGGRIQGANLGNFLGTTLAVIFSNVWAEKTGRPTSIVLIPATVFMVSGSIGFRGLVAMSAGNTALGQSEFVQMFVVALTIGAGMIVGNTLYRPRITL
ncbi:MAG: threonine/serine exporter ThrE family protein [Candidatus Xenobiia bacterium LiM19]